MLEPLLFEIVENPRYILLVNVSAFCQAIVELERAIDVSAQKHILIFLTNHAG